MLQGGNLLDMKFTEDGRLLASLEKARGLLKSASVEIGLPDSAPERSRWLLALHERGAPGAHIPPRPVVGPALARPETRESIADGLAEACEAAAKGDPAAVRAGFEAAGQAGADGIR